MFVKRPFGRSPRVIQITCSIERNFGIILSFLGRLDGSDRLELFEQTERKIVGGDLIIFLPKNVVFARLQSGQWLDLGRDP